MVDVCTTRSYVARLAVSVALIAALLVASSPMSAKKKKTDVAPAPQKRDIQWDDFDLSKIVWPQPPAIARIKVIGRYVGEKIEREPENQKKPKANWMDRVAGAQPIEERKITKIAFQLIAPLGMAIDSKGIVYVADQRVGAIFMFNPETKATELIRNGQDAHFSLLNGIALDDNDRLFVADGKLKHVLVFGPTHQFENYITEGLVHPVGVAIDTENRLLYVVDVELDQVLVYDADSYKLVRKLGVTGKKHESTAPGEFAKPGFAAVDGNGLVYITDTWNNRVEVFDADGGFVREFGKAGDGPGDFQRPKGIAVDSDGHIWVADSVAQRVQVFNNQGRLLTYFGSAGTYPGQFSSLNSVAIDKQNRVFTAEQQPGRIQIFRYVTDSEAAEEKKRRDEEREKKSQVRDGLTKTAPKSSMPAAESVSNPASGSAGKP